MEEPDRANLCRACDFHRELCGSCIIYFIFNFMLFGKVNGAGFQKSRTGQVSIKEYYYVLLRSHGYLTEPWKVSGFFPFMVK